VADLDDYNQFNRKSSKFPTLKKKIIVRIYTAVIWLTTALILLTITKLASYEDIKYFFWAVSVLNPLLFLLYVKGVPQQLSKEEERRGTFILAFSFICLILTFFAAILIGH
jgi:hypothetical protein